MDTTVATAPPQTLLLPTLEAIRRDLALTDPQQATSEEPQESARRAYAKEVAERLFALKPNDLEALHAQQRAVEGIGALEQREAASKSEMLKEPIRTIAAQSEDGGPVARSLIDLKLQVEALDPANFDFSEGWFSRMVGFIPGIGTPLKRYFTRFETAQTVLTAIRNSLINGQKQLERDVRILSDDQAALNALNLRLMSANTTAQLVDEQLTALLERESDAERRAFIEQEVLFPLRQRITDIQQSVVVNQQGVMAMELLRRTNRELIRGVDRALTTTMSALQVAVTVATGAAHARLVLDKIEGVNATTSSLIEGTAKTLRKTVADTNKLASSAMLSMESLRAAFVDTRAAIDDVMTFRSRALPQMAKTILELNQMTEQQAQVIKRMDEGGRVADEMAIQFHGA